MPSIQCLLALGASLVCKARTSQFTHGAQPWEYVDHAYSLNPHGDGHLTASALSSGSACTIAGSKWDDFAAVLSKHLKITVVPINFTTSLLDHIPSHDFAQFQLASNTLAEYRSWVSVGKPLVEAYKDQFNSTPTFDLHAKAMFACGEKHTAQDFVAAQRVLHAFRESVALDLIKADIKSCSDSLFMYDASTSGRPSYRVEEFKHMEGAAQALLAGPVGGDGNTAKPSDYFIYGASM